MVTATEHRYVAMDEDILDGEPIGDGTGRMMTDLHGSDPRSSVCFRLIRVPPLIPISASANR